VLRFGGIKGDPPRKPFGRVSGIEKHDRSWGVGEFRGKVHSEVIKIIHPEGEGSKAESLFLGLQRLLP